MEKHSHTSLQMEKKSVQVISVCTVLPATYTPSPVARRIDFTPWDLQFLPFPPNLRGLIFSADLVPDLLQRLKESLSRTLDFFYPLAGQMCCIKNVSNDSSLFYIECNNAGVKFTHAVTDEVTMADLLHPVYVPSTRRLLFDLSGFECDPKPFLTVQVTQLANNGFFLGCALNHVFADGNSFWHIFNSWSEICRGCDSPKNPPVLERKYPGQTEIWIPNKFLVKPPPVEEHSSLGMYKERIFIFPKEKMSILKRKAIEESGIQNISSLQAMISFVWKLTCRYRFRHDEEEDDVNILIPIGVRSRMVEPPCSTYYFGNAVHSAITSMKVKDLRAQDALGRAAAKVHELVSSQSEASAKEFITSWIENSNTGPIKIPMKGYTLFVASSPRFDVYGNEFGWGRPLAVRSGAVRELDGKIVLFEGTEKGSVHMELCLPIEAMNLLEKDSEFLHFVQL